MIVPFLINKFFHACHEYARVRFVSGYNVKPITGFDTNSVCAIANHSVTTAILTAKCSTCKGIRNYDRDFRFVISSKCIESDNNYKDGEQTVIDVCLKKKKIAL